jgi:hypothetical protein
MLDRDDEKLSGLARVANALVTAILIAFALVVAYLAITGQV